MEHGFAVNDRSACHAFFLGSSHHHFPQLDCIRNDFQQQQRVGLQVNGCLIRQITDKRHIQPALSFGKSVQEEKAVNIGCRSLTERSATLSRHCSKGERSIVGGIQHISAHRFSQRLKGHRQQQRVYKVSESYVHRILFLRAKLDHTKPHDNHIF